MELAAAREQVPGAEPETRLVGVSSQGFDDDAPVDMKIGPGDLVEAWG